MHIDCDTHYFAPDAFDYLEGRFAALRPRPVFKDGFLVDIAFPGAPTPVPGSTPLPAPGSGNKIAGNCDLDARMADYEKLGIEKQIVLPQFTGWWSYLIEPALATALAHSWNLSILRAAKAQPGQFYGVALLALQDPDGAIAEVQWAKDNGFVAVVFDHTFPVREHAFGTPTATHREVWPVFAKCEALDMPIFFHAVQHGHRMVNLLNFQTDGLDYFSPSNPQMNLVALITSGLLDRYPGLKIIHAEAGARHILDLAKKLDGRYRKLEAEYEEDEGATAISRRKLSSKAPQLVPPDVAKEKNTRMPSSYFRKNFWWTIETEEEALGDAVRLIGAERFLFATDYPHTDPGGKMKYRDVELLAGRADFSEAEKELMRWKNTKELFPAMLV